MAEANTPVNVTNIGGDAGAFSCVTDAAGGCSYTLSGASDSTIGKYGVKVEVGQATNYSAFEVLAGY